MSRFFCVAGTAFLLAAVSSPTSASAQSQPRVSITGDIGILFFDIRCDTAPVPVTIVLKRPGTKRTYRLDRPCGQWSGSNTAMPNIEPRTIASGRIEEGIVSRLELTATGRKSLRRTYDYTVKVGSSTQTTGKLIVKVTVRSAKRIYEGTDAFQNYCKNEGRTILSKNGRLYCVRPGSLERLIYTNKQ